MTGRLRLKAKGEREKGLKPGDAETKTGSNLDPRFTMLGPQAMPMKAARERVTLSMVASSRRPMTPPTRWRLTVVILST